MMTERFRTQAFSVSLSLLLGVLATGITSPKPLDGANAAAVAAPDVLTSPPTLSIPPIVVEQTPDTVPETTTTILEPDTPTPSHTFTPSGNVWEGHVSHYWQGDGCGGCNARQIMGNGEPLDDNRLTIGVYCGLITSGVVVYNSLAKVTNLDTGVSVETKVTDCGTLAPGRIADLTLATARVLGTKTDSTNVRIEVGNTG